MQGGAVGQFLLGESQFSRKHPAGGLAAGLAVGAREQLVDRHRRGALAGRGAGGDLGAPLPGAVDQLDQPFDLSFGCSSVCYVAGADFEGVEGNIMPALLPGQRVCGRRRVTDLLRVDNELRK